jgi:hypothetical protein
MIRLTLPNKLMLGGLCLMVMVPPLGSNTTFLVTGIPTSPSPNEVIVPVPYNTTRLVSTLLSGGASGLIPMDETWKLSLGASPCALLKADIAMYQ